MRKALPFVNDRCGKKRDGLVTNAGAIFSWGIAPALCFRPGIHDPRARDTDSEVQQQRIQAGMEAGVLQQRQKAVAFGTTEKL